MAADNPREFLKDGFSQLIEQAVEAAAEGEQDERQPFTSPELIDAIAFALASSCVRLVEASPGRPGNEVRILEHAATVLTQINVDANRYIVAGIIEQFRPGQSEHDEIPLPRRIDGG